MENYLKNGLRQINHKYNERGEREFCAELYHQLRIIIEKNNQNRFEVSTETIKNVRFQFDDPIFNDPKIRSYFFYSNRSNTTKRIRRQPDLIIHDYGTKKFQELIIEVKKNPDIPLIKKDLSKLIVYCYGRLKYKKGILLLVNTVPQNIERLKGDSEIQKLIQKYPKIEIWSFSNSRIEILVSLRNNMIQIASEIFDEYFVTFDEKELHTLIDDFIKQNEITDLIFLTNWSSFIKEYFDEYKTEMDGNAMEGFVP